VYVNEGNFLGKNINTRRKSATTLFDAHNEVNTEKIRNICLAARVQDKTTTQRELTNPLKMWLIQMFGNETRKKI
jgi:hypothetical protein